MEESEAAAEAMDVAPVVRQLDFAASLSATANSNTSSVIQSIILPDHPQAQIQSKLMALAQSRKAEARAGARSPPLLMAQTKLPPRKMVMPPKSPQRELPQMVVQAKSPQVTPRLAHCVKPVPVPEPASQPLLKMESPKSRERCNLEQNDGTPKKRKRCNCKNSRCLKLYCECFASGIYCVDGCNCTNCHNKIEHDADRKGAIDTILERNPNAFRPKIASSPQGPINGGAKGTRVVEHNKGCNCKKTGCLKKYCECFQANIFCSDKCKCMDCKNFEGSEERKLHFHEYPANSMAFIKQETNAAINGAIGTPSMRSRNQKTASGVASNKKLTSGLYPQNHQGTCLTHNASCSPLPVHESKPEAAASGLSKSFYRSPLSGILQPQHVNDFCTLLVEASTGAAKNLSEERKMMNNIKDACVAEISVDSSERESGDHQNQQNSMKLHGDLGNAPGTSSFESDGTQTGRPLSPGTLALMCDEQDAMFTTANAPSTSIDDLNASATTNSESIVGANQLYAEQERLVLTMFRSFLNGLITCGSIEEAKIEQDGNQDL